MAVEIQDADIADAIWVARHLRDDDRHELAATSLQDPVVAIMATMEHSPWVKVARVNGEPFAIAGVAKQSIIFGGCGSPWMLATDKLQDNWLSFLKVCRPVMAELRQQAYMLENYVDARNKTSISWLRWMGFTLDEPKPYGILGRPFRRFYLEQ